jgi:hypothetical protein
MKEHSGTEGFITEGTVVSYKLKIKTFIFAHELIPDG